MSNIEQNRQKLEAAMDALRHALAGAKQRFSEGLQLTRTQIEIVMLLSSRSCTTRELAASLFLTQSAVTQTINTLVRQGLVERGVDTADRRLIWLGLSQEGRAVARRIGNLRRSYMDKLLRALTEAEVETLISINQKLTHLLDADKEATSK